MQFSCGQCSTRYSVPDDKVRGKRIRTKCRKCGAEIVVDGAGIGGAGTSAEPPRQRPSAPQAAPAGGPARVEEPWTVAISRSDQRKMVTAEVVEAYAAGTITDTTLVWKHGMQRWQPPFDIPAIALALLARGLEPRPRAPDERAKTEPPPAPISTAADWDDEATRVFDAAVVAEDLPSMRPAPPKASAAPPKASAAPPKASSAPSKPDAAISKPDAAISKPDAITSKPDADAAAEWDDANEATKMLAPNRALLAARLPRRRELPPKPAALKPHPPPVPPRRSTAPARTSKPALAPSVPPPAPKPPPAPSVPPPGGAPSRGALTPSPTKSVEATHPVPTVRPPPGSAPADPFGFEDEATAVFTADRARALLEEQLDKPPGPPEGETPMAFGSEGESKQTAVSSAAGAADAVALPKMKREPLRSHDDLVEKGPTIVVSDSEKRISSTPPPPEAAPSSPPTPPPSGRPSARDFGGIQHERTRVVRPRSKATGPLFWLALIVALTAAAFAGYYASRLLDPSRSTAPQRR